MTPIVPVTAKAVRSSLAALLLLAGSATHAGLLYYDGFPTEGTDAYSSGKLGNNVNPAHASIVGFKDSEDNKWSAGSSANVIWTDTLAYPAGITLTSQNGEYTCGRGSGSPRGAYRPLSSPSLAGEEVLYYSFLMRFHGAFPSKFTEDFVAFDTKGVSSTGSPLSKDFGADGFVVSMTNMGDHVEMQLKTDADSATLVSSVSAGATYFIVVKHEKESGVPHVISASVLTEPVEPTIWDVSITTAVRSTSPTKMQVGGYGANSTANYWEFDEIRIGTTFADVAGEAATGAPAVFDGTTSMSGIGYDEGNATAQATFSAAFSDAGSPAAEVILYWGESNGGTSAEAWDGSASLGTLDGLSVSRTLTGLALGKTFFYRFAAVNGNVVTWGVPAQSAFVTAEMTPVAPSDIDECSIEPATVEIGPGFSVAADIPVNFVLGGTAQYGTDYTSASSPLTLPSGASVASCDIYPVRDLVNVGAKSVTLTVLTGPYILPADPTVSFSITDAVLPASPTNAFLGGVSALASEPDNWSLGHVPAADETVLYDLRYGRIDMEWDDAAPKSVGSWVQSANQTNRVVFFTTVESPLSIAGNAFLLGGFWTHAGPSNAPVHSLSVSVGGNMTVASGTAINVGRDVPGVDPLGTARGYVRSGPGFLTDFGGAFGGESYGHAAGLLNTNCYGSILNPLVWGSAARGSGTAFARYAGPGLVNLSVGGVLNLEGGIYANGYSYSNNGGGASGGAINVACGRLTGNGVLSANGGTDVYAGSGSGGRIRVKLSAQDADKANFSGSVTADGGLGGNPGNLGLYDSPSTAAGTIFWQGPADDALAGDVWVVNTVDQRTMTNETARVHPATQFPPRIRDAFDSSYSLTRWHLGDNAKLRLTANVSVASLEVLSPSGSKDAPVLFTDGHILTVKRLDIAGTAYPTGRYTATDLPALIVGDGAVVVDVMPTVLLVR